MKVEEITSDQIRISEKISRCADCGKPMISFYSDLRKIKSISSSIVVQSYDIDNVCSRCKESGKYSLDCDICENTKYPSDFLYLALVYPKYPGCETEYHYLCKKCVKERPAEVLEIVVESSDIRKIQAA